MITPKEWDSRIVRSRRLLAECRRKPNPDNLARAETEHGLIMEMIDQVELTKTAKVRALARLYQRFLKAHGIETRARLAKS